MAEVLQLAELRDRHGRQHLADLAPLVQWLDQRLVRTSRGGQD